MGRSALGDTPSSSYVRSGRTEYSRLLFSPLLVYSTANTFSGQVFRMETCTFGPSGTTVKLRILIACRLCWTLHIILRIPRPSRGLLRRINSHSGIRWFVEIEEIDCCRQKASQWRDDVRWIAPFAHVFSLIPECNPYNMLRPSEAILGFAGTVTCYSRVCKCSSNYDNDHGSAALHASRHTMCALPAGCIPSSRCLDAVIVALGQACDERKWYSSIRQLQLTSVGFCVACRSAPINVLVVDDDTPSRLLAGADDLLTEGEDEHESTRQPILPFRAVGVKWKIGSSQLMNRTMYSLKYTRFLHFGEYFNDRIDRVTWPALLQQLTFGKMFNRSIDSVTWPASLQQLTFGKDFTQPIERVSWPSSLRQLTFGTFFSCPIYRVVWPESLQILTFGVSFNMPIDGVSWPCSLQQLTFGARFNKPIEGVSWPESLKRLTFGIKFNRPIDSASWPASLQHLTFGTYFNQPIDSVSWPASLQHLTFGRTFNQPIVDVAWPAMLQRVTFGDSFTQALDGVSWPASLQQLILGKMFNRPSQSRGQHRWWSSRLGSSSTGQSSMSHGRNRSSVSRSDTTSIIRSRTWRGRDRCSSLPSGGVSISLSSVPRGQRRQSSSPLDSPSTSPSMV